MFNALLADAPLGSMRILIVLLGVPLRPGRPTVFSVSMRRAATLSSRVAPDAASLPQLLALIARMAERDEKALETFYRQTVKHVYGIACRVLRNPVAAEEVTGEVFHQAWLRAARFDAERGHPLAWLTVMARSRALDYLRAQDRAELHPEPETLAPHASTEEAGGDLLDALDRQSAVHAAITALSPVQRQLVALAFFRGLSHSEIAVHAALPLGTVKSHLRYALQSLRVTLDRRLS